MPLSWNEIRHRAIQFAHNWTGTRSEAAEKQTFWNEFFDVFGIQRRLVASFEEPVKRISGQYGYIDLFWKSTLLVEHKSAGQDLGKAQSQAFQYLQDLLNEGRAKDAPRYVIVSDFARIALHDLEPEAEAAEVGRAVPSAPPLGQRSGSLGTASPTFDSRRVHTLEFPLADLHKHIHAFAFTRFHVENMPTASYLVIPEVSSERRTYIPLGFLKPDVICSNKLRILPAATLFHFGILSSAMHMAWVRQVTGRLESRFQYSVKLVYNNYPWPQSPTAKQKEAIEAAAQKVLDVRAQFPSATLADLYDPLSMPPALVKAHAELDRAVDLCYRSQPFTSERQRVEYLFNLYEQLTAPLLPPAKPKRAARKKAVYARPPRAPVHPSLTPEQAQADAAHFYSAKEEPPPYRA